MFCRLRLYYFSRWISMTQGTWSWRQERRCTFNSFLYWLITEAGIYILHYLMLVGGCVGMVTGNKIEREVVRGKMKTEVRKKEENCINNGINTLKRWRKKITSKLAGEWGKNIETQNIYPWMKVILGWGSPHCACPCTLPVAEEVPTVEDRVEVLYVQEVVTHFIL